MIKVVILSPSRFSLFTICVAALLKKQDIEVSAIIVRRLFNPHRFMFEFRHQGSRLISKIIKKLLLRGKAYKKNTDYETIADLIKKEKIDYKNVDDFKRDGVSVIYCYDLNDDNVVEALKRHQPDLVIFTGGGLVRKHILEQSGAGILNCHSGILPAYRGMDVIEWPILENNADEIGVTIHFMDEGVDTGDILRIKKINVEAGQDLNQIKDRFEPYMCLEMVKACVDYQNGSLKRTPQNYNDGKQYFIMHPQLVNIVENRLMQRNK